MRICLYTDTALPKLGQQEMAVDALARHFQKLGHQPVVLAPKPGKRSVQGESVPYEVVRHPRFLSTNLFISWYRWFLLKQFHRQRFEVLHCHGIHPPAYLAALSREQVPTPIVVTGHDEEMFADNVRPQNPAIVERCVQGLRRADALIAISRFTREGFTRLCPEAAPRIVDIPNGVHQAALTEHAATPPAGFGKLMPGEYAIYVGRLKYRKGVDLLLHAIARAAEVGKAQLAIVGDGDERPFLEILCDQLGIHERVQFFSKSSEAAKSYLSQNARFGVVPSRQPESFGSAVLEGYASGLPMIATDVPGLADLVTPNKTGLLVPPESPDALAAALVRLFADDALVRRMGQAARQVVQQYDWENVARRHLALYEGLLGGRQRMAA